VIRIERLPSSAFIASKDLAYVDVFKLHELYDDLAYRANLILVGPKGVGKTLSVVSWAAKHDASIVTYDCSEDVRRSNLIGMNNIQGNETYFLLGPLTTAFEVANETGHCILALEECGSLAPTLQKILNPISDFRKRLEVPEAGKVFQLEGAAKLWIVGTMNLSIMGGVYALNEDLKSRFRFVDVGYPPPLMEVKIVEAALKHLKFEAKVLDAVITLAHETRQKALDYALSPRDVIQIVEDITLMGADKALRLAVGKFEGHDKATVAARINSLFVDVNIVL